MISSIIFFKFFLCSLMLLSLYASVPAHLMNDPKPSPGITRRRGRGRGGRFRYHRNRGPDGKNKEGEDRKRLCSNLPKMCCRLAKGFPEHKLNKLNKFKPKHCTFQDPDAPDEKCPSDSQCIGIRIRKNGESPSIEPVHHCSLKFKKCICIHKSDHEKCNLQIEQVLKEDGKLQQYDSGSGLSLTGNSEGEKPKVEKDGCIAMKHLKQMHRSELIFDKNKTTYVLCDQHGSCATPGHMVTWLGSPMMMRTYCKSIKVRCEKHIMEVNSPRWRLRRMIQTETPGLLFTSYAAKYESTVEEQVLSLAIRSGI